MLYILENMTVRQTGRNREMTRLPATAHLSYTEISYMREPHAIISIHFHGGSHDKITPPLSGIKLLTIAVLAALSGSALSTTLPTEPSSSPIGLSGNYELAGDLALGSTDTEQTESFYTASGNASITLTDDSSITLNNAFSIDGGLFSNATDHSIDFIGNGHDLTINHVATEGSYPLITGSTIKGKNLNFTGIHSLKIAQKSKSIPTNSKAFGLNIEQGTSSIKSTDQHGLEIVSISVESAQNYGSLDALALTNGTLETDARNLNLSVSLGTEENTSGSTAAGLSFRGAGSAVGGVYESHLNAPASDIKISATSGQNTSISAISIIFNNKATITANRLTAGVTASNGDAYGLFFDPTNNDETTNFSLDADADFTVKAENGSAKGIYISSGSQVNSFYNGPITFSKKTSFDVTASGEAFGIDIRHGQHPQFVFEDDAVISVSSETGNATGVFSNEPAGTFTFNGNTTIKAASANAEAEATAIDISFGASLKAGVSEDGTSTNGKTVKIEGDVKNNTYQAGSALIGLTGKDSYLTGNVYDATASGADNKIVLFIEDEAKWNNSGESHVNTIHAKGGTIKLSDGSTVAINDLTVTDQGLNVFVNEVSGAPRVTVENKSGDGRIAVTGSNTLNDSYGNVDAMIRDLSQVVQENGTEGTSLVDTVTAEEGKIRGEVTSTLSKDGQWQTTVKSNVSLEGYSALSSLAAVNWRHEMNDVTKRMGELRDSNGKAGAWARAYGSELEYGAQNVTSKNTSIQVGADYALTDEWKMGAAFSYTDGSMTFDRGDGDNKAYGLAIYGTWMAENGLFVDLIGKYSRLETEFTSNKLAGEFDNNGWSLSAEAGWRFKPVDEAFVEPQVELTYGRLEGDAFHGSNGVNIVQDDFDSLIGRAGVRAGFFFPEKKGTIYAKASVAHDFKGDMESFAYLDEPYTPTATLKDELGGTWYEFGLGANFNWSETTYAYVDLQRTTAGNVNEAWRWNVGVRHAF